tara:strand:- start:7157 stop:8134 length:978 start_codon:yes stop_codon:yes gene_type:complete
MFLIISLVRCTPDYALITSDTEYIYTHTEGETIYVEVPGETIYIEDTGDFDANPVWVDSFQQPASVNGVDILWVIDRSGSMMDDADRIVAGVDAMMHSLPEAGWRLVMITTDPSESEVNNFFPLVPGDTTADADAMYSMLPASSSWEKGFDATYHYMVNNPYSSTWMRPDAALLVVFVSDEDDDSTSPMVSETNFIEWYRAQRPTVSVASIVNYHPDVSPCNPVSWYEGVRYMNVTNHFGGVIVDICSDDWSPGVTDATAQVEPRESIALTYEPEVDSIRLFIDHVLQPVSSFSYNVGTNEVVFTVIPPGNTLVEIGYRYDPEAQ